MFNLATLDTAIGDQISTADLSDTNGVWNTEAEQGTAFPYVVFQGVSDSLQYGMRGSATIGTYRYLVRCIAEGISPVDVKNLDYRVYAVLHNASLVVPGVGTVSVKGQNGMPMSDPEGNSIYARYYEIKISKG